MTCIDIALIIAMESYFPTSIVDINREILYRLDVKSIKVVCTVNKELYALCDDFFWRNRFIRDYVDLGYRVDYKQIFNKVLSLANITELMYFSAIEGYPMLFEFAIKNGANIYTNTDNLPLIIMNQGQCDYKSDISSRFDPFFLSNAEYSYLSDSGSDSIDDDTIFDANNDAVANYYSDTISAKDDNMSDFDSDGEYPYGVYGRLERRQIFDRNKNNILKILEILFASGFKINDNMKIGTISKMCVLYNAVDIINLLCNNDVKTDYFLELVSEKNRPDIIQLFIDCNFNIDCRYYYGNLCNTARTNNMQTVKMFLFDDKYISNKERLIDAFLFVISYRNIEFMQRLLDDNVNIVNKDNSNKDCRLIILQFFLEKGVDIHAQQEEALIRAVRYNDILVVQFLLKNGADIHAQQDEALIRSASFDNLPMIQLLLENGADIHAQQDRALISAAQFNLLQNVQFLLENGADIHAQQDEALILAASNGHLSIVTFLLCHGANVHAQQDNALVFAAKGGHISVVSELLDRGANIHAQNNNALKFAANNGKLSVGKLLLDRGADIHAFDAGLPIFLSNALQYYKIVDSLRKYINDNDDNNNNNNQCAAITKKGSRCKNKPVLNCVYCHIHK